MARCCLSPDMSHAKALLRLLAGTGTARTAHFSSLRMGKWGTTQVNISLCSDACRAASCPPYHGVGVCHLQELRAALRVPERADPQAVGRVELLHQEVAAHLNDLGELQEARSSQQTLYGVFL